MAFILRDDQVQSYDESWDVVLAAIVTKGFAQVVQNLFGFFLAAGVVGDVVCFIYEATQVRAGKLQGTGESILACQKVYATLGSNFQLVTANPAGVIGTDYYFCGWAKRDADEDDEDVLIHFCGTEYNHADQAV